MLASPLAPPGLGGEIDFFRKVNFVIPVDRKKNWIGGTFGGVLGPPCPTGRAGQPRPYTCTKFRIVNKNCATICNWHGARVPSPCQT